MITQRSSEANSPMDTKNALLCAVQKILPTFNSEIDKPIQASGTGFWLLTKRGNLYFVTNRHNIDPTMHGENYSSRHLASVTILLRAYSQRDSLPCKDVFHLQVPIEELTIVWPKDNCDVVLLRAQRLSKPIDPNFVMLSIPDNAMTYHRKPEIIDSLYFVGFPAALRKSAEYDLPIVRSCTIASFPEIDYSQEDSTIPSSETCLVEGLSFGGSSGSPVLRKHNEFLELFGIMSGHFREGSTGSLHAGLSYIAKATSIQRLVQDNAL